MNDVIKSYRISKEWMYQQRPWTPEKLEILDVSADQLAKCIGKVISDEIKQDIELCRNGVPVVAPEKSSLKPRNRDLSPSEMAESSARKSEKYEHICSLNPVNL